MKILVTGRNGQVGHELERELNARFGAGTEAAAEIIMLDRSQLDLSDPDRIRCVIRNLRPALIVNPAAHTAVDLLESEPELAMRINGVAPGIIAEEAKHVGAALIHYSTDYVFDGSAPGPYAESDPTCPINAYGRSKLAGELAIAATGVSHLILRTSWVYGAYGKNFLKTIERLAAERDTLRIVADQHGAPTWSRTIARGTASAIAALCGGAAGQPLTVVPERWQQDGGICHLTAQGCTTWHGFAGRIVASGPRAGKVTVVPIATEEYPVPAPRPRNSRLSCDRFQQRFGALPAWEAALDECIATAGAA